MLAPTVAPDANLSVTAKQVGQIAGFYDSWMVANTYDGSITIVIGPSDNVDPEDWSVRLAQRSAVMDLLEAGWSEDDVAMVLSRNLSDMILRR